VRSAIPESGDLGAAVGRPDDASGLAWTDLSGDPGYLPIDRLTPKMGVRLRLSGALDALPELHAYYLAVGIVDESIESPRSVERQFVTGPNTIEATETLRFERP